MAIPDPGTPVPMAMDALARVSTASRWRLSWPGPGSRTLRFDEPRGLTGTARTAGGTRQYSEYDRGTLCRISALPRVGVNLAGIRPAGPGGRKPGAPGRARPPRRVTPRQAGTGTGGDANRREHGQLANPEPHGIPDRSSGADPRTPSRVRSPRVFPGLPNDWVVSSLGAGDARVPRNRGRPSRHRTPWRPGCGAGGRSIPRRQTHRVPGGQPRPRAPRARSPPEAR